MKGNPGQDGIQGRSRMRMAPVKHYRSGMRSCRAGFRVGPRMPHGMIGHPLKRRTLHRCMMILQQFYRVYTDAGVCPDPRQPIVVHGPWLTRQTRGHADRAGPLTQFAVTPQIRVDACHRWSSAQLPPEIAIQTARCRNDATPAMNICTDSAISNMPITRSSAVSTLSPSQRNR